MKNFFLLLALLLCIAGCKKEDQGCTPVKPEDEETQIINYASANGITVSKHSSGIYYEVIAPGTGGTPTLNSKIFVTYKGKLLSNTIFDESASIVNFKLSDVIEGWQIGIPLIKKGGHVKLIIPSSFAYGCNGSGTVPPNAVLYFDVNLIDVE